ncbi:Helix-turn-helix domain-containing protein [Fodinibius roseus]|uniref:Helix-turn-helix domain-containing protein n=1 Tax=Fodinibius roseus TaxID=1194090 RepID=A0A1M5C896_9BACT|nr:helix-turn-helix domain-containing protein [Fodinibius roseus]SHF50612.1 Helix-turn-helix domain-containing protein [Fodinibius roseus]
MNKRINPYKLWNGSFVPEWLMPRTEISQGAKLAYARLARFAGKNGYCNPKISTLAAEIGVSDRQCSTYLNELVEYELIAKKQRGLGKSNEYHFYSHKWMELPSEVSEASGQDMKKTSGQGGRKLHDKDEDNFKSHSKESHNKESQIEERELSNLSFDDFDVEEQPLQMVTLHIYQEIKDFNEHLDTLKGATLEEWIQPLQQLIDESESLDAHKLNDVFSFVKRHDNGWWMDKIKSTDSLKKNFASIYGQYKKEQNEILPEYHALV